MVAPRFYPTWASVNHAVQFATTLVAMFTPGSREHTQFASILAYYTNIQNLIDSGLATVTSLEGTPVYVYTQATLTPIVYGSINTALSALHISFGKLLSCVQNRYLFGPSNYVLSMVPLTPAQIASYTPQPETSNQMRTNVSLYSPEGVLLEEFDSGRAFNR